MNLTEPELATQPGTADCRQTVVLPAKFSMVAALRAAVAGMITDSPLSCDTQHIAHEFAITALQEQACTYCPTAVISATVDRDDDRIRLEIDYHLSLTHAPQWDREAITSYERGLAIITALSDRWGHVVRTGQNRYPDDHHTWWAELDLPAPDL